MHTLGLNMASLESRLAELRAQHDAGAISEDEHDAGRAAAFEGC